MSAAPKKLIDPPTEIEAAAEATDAKTQAAPSEGEAFDGGLEVRAMPEAGASAEEITESLILNLDGFEGPLDLLLVLARSQKVDLRKISILALADQFLEFVLAARRMRLEMAADYLVMAAWLTYLKSRLLLPEPPSNDDEPSGEEMAARLAFQLQRLEAMRGVAARLMTRDRLGLEIFQRGDPEGIRLIRTPDYQADLYDLLKAYSIQRAAHSEVFYEVRKRTVYAIEDARERIEAMLGHIPDWSQLEMFLPESAPKEGNDRRTYLASALSAALELAKEGHLEIRQTGMFEPIFLRPVKRVEEGALMAANDQTDSGE